jgi:uncharacterized protein (TIGR01244 family)
MADDPTPQEIARTLPYGGAPADNVLTAGQPTPDQIARLGRIGCAAVVDLRATGEPRGYDEPAAVAAAGMEYVHLPVTADTLSDGEFDRLREYLRAHADRPVLVHCASANRVGALLLPFFMLDQKRPRDEAVAMAQRVGMRSPDLLQKALAYVAARS